MLSSPTASYGYGGDGLLPSTLSNPPLESNDIKDPKYLSTLGGGVRSIESNEPVLKMNYLRILFLAFESFFKRVFKNVFQLTFLYIAYKYIFSQLADIRKSIFLSLCIT